MDGEETALSQDNEYILESLNRNVDVSVTFKWHFDDKAPVSVQAERLRRMLKTVGEKLSQRRAFYTSEVTVDNIAGSASFTARGNTFGNMIDEYGVPGGFRVTVYSSEADAAFVWGDGIEKGQKDWGIS